MPRSHLRALAAHVGILDSYVEQGGHRRETSDRSRVALLRAMGIEAASEPAAREALAELRARAAAAIIAPARVASPSAARRLPVRPSAHSARTWTVEVEFEDGARHIAAGRGAPQTIALPALPFGYHRVRLELGDSLAGEQRLIVVPPRCPTPRERLGGVDVYGLLANLYSVHSERNWGIGDLSDLRRLVDWSARIGAAFVGINPLHALENRGDQISPYSPVTRLYRNVMYLDVCAVPEWAALPARQRRVIEASPALKRVRGGERVDYDAVRAIKSRAFEALYRVFTGRHRNRADARGRAYSRYLAEQGEALNDFATFVALHERFVRRGVRDWHRWPARFRNPRSDAVHAWRDARRESVELHCYLQFELDRQLAATAAAARAQAMPIGVYQDLALGSSRQGSDVWAFPEIFLDRVDIGAPPDNYSADGQNWQLPAINPRALAATGYDYWIRLVRAALRHAGALRIDHVLGLFRQYWIPAGASAKDGAYVRFPTEDLFGILALESQRAGALVIGEDLGTVPRGLPRVLARQSLLSTRVLYFERGRGGSFRPSRAYPRRTLVGANTHDLSPLAGFWIGADLALRRSVGAFRDARVYAAAQQERERERRALVRRLRTEGVLPRARRMPTELELRAAVHAFLARTPAALVGVSLDDLSGEHIPVNVPGVPLRRYPSWSRRMRLSLEAFRRDTGVRRALDGLPTSRRSLRHKG